MTDSDSGHDRFPRQAPIRRRLVHWSVAACGWAIFVYWWWLVFGRVSRREVVFTAIFVGVTTLLTILITSIWSLHNKRLHRRKVLRRRLRTVQESYSRDTLLRVVSFVGGAERVRREELVLVQVGENRKDYQAASTTDSDFAPGWPEPIVRRPPRRA